MRNFSRFDGTYNISGYFQHYFIEDSRIISLPADDNGVIDLDNIVYTNPADNDWYAGASVLKSLDLGSNLAATINGSSVPVSIEGTAALQDAHNLKLFHEKSFLRFIVILIDRNGNMRICGEPGNGLRFTFKEIQGGFQFAYNAEYNHPCWYVTGNFTVDGTVFGSTYIPGTSVIIGADGKSAYEVAVANGFVGTEAEWIDSLPGTDGRNIFVTTELDPNEDPSIPANINDYCISANGFIWRIINIPLAGDIWVSDGINITGPPGPTGSTGVAADEDFTTISAFKFLYNY